MGIGADGKQLLHQWPVCWDEMFLCNLFEDEGEIIVLLQPWIIQLVGMHAGSLGRWQVVNTPPAHL